MKVNGMQNYKHLCIILQEKINLLEQLISLEEKVVSPPFDVTPQDPAWQVPQDPKPRPGYILDDDEESANPYDRKTQYSRWCQWQRDHGFLCN